MIKFAPGISIGPRSSDYKSGVEVGNRPGKYCPDRSTHQIAYKVIETPETIAPKPIKPKDAACDWENYVGADYTNIHPRSGKVDQDRLVSADGKRSIRYGKHEMNSKPNKHHYHKERWHYDDTTDTITYENEMVRCPLEK